MFPGTLQGLIQREGGIHRGNYKGLPIADLDAPSRHRYPKDLWGKHYCKEVGAPMTVERLESNKSFFLLESPVSPGTSPKSNDSH